ncbi:MAG: MGMT family protein [Fimbriimonadaceae bacterium]|nr:MGMT family protein [Fimbriimonadaceae bacterium]QYK55625.1 MAG: MGMT family protein [Fimbriimonadaceae bacterium]
MDQQTVLAELESLIKKVPPGQVVSYGTLGASLCHPASGWMVGRMIRRVTAEIPWWRVVSQSGVLPISKADPRLAIEQRRLLESEGILFENGRVPQRYFTEPQF